MSNGSERTPERCVHAPDGPDWAGLRELNNATVDYKAIVAEARQIADEEPKGAGTLRALAATVESLLAENLRRHAALHEWETVGAPAWVAAKDAQIAEVWAERDAVVAENAQLRGDLSENRRALDDAINVANSNKSARDALQARLDAMTTESRFHRLAVDGKGRIIAGRLVEEQRLVGPWTAVPEGVQP